MHCGELVSSSPSRGHSQQLLFCLSAASVLSRDALWAKHRAAGSTGSLLQDVHAARCTGHRAQSCSSAAAQSHTCSCPPCPPCVLCTSLSASVSEASSYHLLLIVLFCVRSASHSIHPTCSALLSPQAHADAEFRAPESSIYFFSMSWL